MDKLEAMQVYVCVVDTHSFIRAAEVLGVPRSTVSRVVKELESWLKIQLLQRSPGIALFLRSRPFCASIRSWS